MRGGGKVDEISGSVEAAAFAPAKREMSGRQPRSQHDAEMFLNCSRCGLSIRARFVSLEVEHCPRCLARARLLQPLFRSPLPITRLCEGEHARESQVDAPPEPSDEPSPAPGSLVG